MHPDAQPAAPMSPLPAGRSIASLRAPRGTNFIRLAFAALFLLGFLGLVGFLLKDYIPGLIPSLTGHDLTEESAKSGSTLKPSIPSATGPLTSSPSKPAEAPADKTTASTSATGDGKTDPRPITVGFDPQEPVTSTPKVSPAQGSTAMASASTTSPPAAANGTAMANAATSTPTPTTPGALLEVPPTPTPNTAAANNPAVAPSGLGEAQAIEEEGIPPAAKPAADAIKKFLAAKNLSERLQYTLGADLMKPLMERYYARSPEGPITVDRIQFVRMDPNPELGTGRHCILSLENKTWEFPVPVMLEEKDDGFKVDWIAFVEFKDRMLEKFFQSYQEGKARFHVGIIRHHYFEDGVPNLDHKDVFRISPAPPNSFQASVFLDKDSPLAVELRTMLPWETHVWAVVELEWKKLGSQQWVELSAVPQMHWYSLPMTTAKAIPAPQKAGPVEDDIPPGITKNGKRGKSSEVKPAEPPPGIRKSTPDLPATIKRPLPAGR
ncbi:hypothetical protein [Prosthecobacter vanneervenii]|uniref:Uncharacterized protein n=1 Tax=Prosthecobacter vanneervenii TaxID=48466 RepID=A0A7W8DJI8_9BACT|nr:hypothetical protein [Prosthecobacter vanneervenii]MBB5032075.1 hypothetical protein [Prosthecobacter vanneervenii]